MIIVSSAKEVHKVPASYHLVKRRVAAEMERLFVGRSYVVVLEAGDDYHEVELTRGATLDLLDHKQIDSIEIFEDEAAEEGALEVVLRCNQSTTATFYLTDVDAIQAFIDESDLIEEV